MLREKLKAYIDANVPIIYVNSYDDNACLLYTSVVQRVLISADLVVFIFI